MNAVFIVAMATTTNGTEKLINIGGFNVMWTLILLLVVDSLFNMKNLANYAIGEESSNTIVMKFFQYALMFVLLSIVVGMYVGIGLWSLAFAALMAVLVPLAFSGFKQAGIAISFVSTFAFVGLFFTDTIPLVKFAVIPSFIFTGLMGFFFFMKQFALASVSFQLALYASVVGYFFLVNDEYAQYSFLVNEKRSISLNTFVQQLEKGVKNEKVLAFIKGGLTDGVLKDDQVNVVRDFIRLKDLYPTQSEIDMDKSVGFYLERDSNKTNMLQTIQKSLPPVQKNEIRIPPAPITVAMSKGGKFWIVDGHHRWSQQVIFAGLKDSFIEADIIIAWEKNIVDPVTILKLAHLSIASVDSQVPTKDANAKYNVFAMDETQLVQYYKDLPSRLGEVVVPANYAKISAITQPAVSKDASAFLVERSLTLKPFKSDLDLLRKNMPQFDALSPVDNKMLNLKLGAVNFRAPYR